MRKKQGIRFAVAAAFMAAFGVSGLALAVDELEKDFNVNNNAAIANAQPLTIGSDGSVTVYGVVGEFWPSDPTRRDTVDIYSFKAKAGDEVVVDIDGGIKPTGTPRSVDTSLYILGPGIEYFRYIFNLTALELDEGSIDRKDARIPLFLVPADGTYHVAVTTVSQEVRTGGLIFGTGLTSAHPGGTYTLIISGVTPPEQPAPPPPVPQAQKIHISVKPGSGDTAPINPNAKGNIPVALLSSDKFNALNVEPSSLRFGRTGTEESWLRCAKDGVDVNGDGYLDLVCHFDNQLAKFEADTVAGIVKGKLKSVGAAAVSASAVSDEFEGHGDLKVRLK